MRNCTMINVLDGCSISLPAHREGEAPVGLMLAAGATMIDAMHIANLAAGIVVGKLGTATASREEMLAALT